jgi:hypothetical protein
LSDWQLGRLPGDVRQEAENAAQRDGLPLHRWLGKLIRETSADEGVSPGRELSRGRSGEAGNGHRHQPSQQPAMPQRVPVEPIRMAPEARSVNPSPEARAVEPQRAAPTNGTYRAANGREAQTAAAPVVARQSEPQRQPNRAVPPAREPAPPTAPRPASPPPAAARLSPQSTAPAVSPSPRGMPPMPPAQPTQNATPTSTPSRFAAEPRPASQPAPAPAASAPAATPEPAVLAPIATVTASVTPEASPSDERMAALAKLVQGLRRNELSPIGEARIFLKLMTEHMASIGDITIATGRTKDQIARSLRLLGLSDRLRDLIDRGALSREQAFALLDADDPDTANPVVPPSGRRVS